MYHSFIHVDARAKFQKFRGQCRILHYKIKGKTGIT